MSDCVHHWRIETPNGTPEVDGVCKNCGEQRVFHSSTDWEIAYNNQRTDKKGRKPKSWTGAPMVSE